MGVADVSFYWGFVAILDLWEQLPKHIYEQIELYWFIEALRDVVAGRELKLSDDGRSTCMFGLDMERDQEENNSQVQKPVREMTTQMDTLFYAMGVMFFKEECRSNKSMLKQSDIELISLGLVRVKKMNYKKDSYSFTEYESELSDWREGVEWGYDNPKMFKSGEERYNMSRIWIIVSFVQFKERFPYFDYSQMEFDWVVEALQNVVAGRKWRQSEKTIENYESMFEAEYGINVWLASIEVRR